MGVVQVKNVMIDERARKLAQYIIDTGDTVRGAAKKFGVSKSTVHKDVSDRLNKINPSLAKDVRKILDENKAERHLRGGMATKLKYMKEKEIEINGEKIKIALKLPKEEIEDNNIKIYLDDTIDLTKTIKEVKEETNNEQKK